MRNILGAIHNRWRRRKHKGVSGNFSTLVIVGGIIVGSYFMSGGGYPEVYPTYSGTVIRGEPLLDQPTHSKEFAMTFRELQFRQLPTGTPTPIPTFGPSPSPDIEEGTTPTATPPATVGCSQESISFLIDVSGSMLATNASGQRKIDLVRNAISSFTNGLSDNALLSIYTFSEPFNGIKGDGVGEQASSLSEPTREPRERLSMSKYGSVKNTIPSILSQLEPYPWAATYMRDGLTGANTWLKAAKAANPDYAQNLIFISDGIPETDVRNYSIAPTDTQFGADRAYSPLQDPTTAPNIAQQIKTGNPAGNVNVYSIVIYTQQDALIMDKLSSIMKNVATSPNEPFYDVSLNAENINTILNGIKQNICE